MPEPGKTVYVVSLGCSKAQVDAEAALATLVARGYTLADQPEGADMVVVNTCGFIEPAVQESVDTIVSLGDMKDAGDIGELVVGGCLVDRYGTSLGDELPEVDRFFGSGAFRQWADRERGQRILASPGPALPDSTDGRILLNAPHYSYLKIAEGCDRACAFCTIPSIRGKQRSRAMADILAELDSLAAQGVREAVLVSQDTVRWGLDLEPRQRLGDLMNAIELGHGPDWVRLHYLYPDAAAEAIVDQLAAGDRIVPYVDVPIQHVSDDVLARMRRAHRRHDIERLVERLRTVNPDISIRTTVIVGHPGESDQDVTELCRFLSDIRFDAVGIFTYWDEEGTRSAEQTDKVDPDEQQDRAAAVEDAAREAAELAAERFVGRMLPVLADGLDPVEGRDWIGRHPGQAPDVDGIVILRGFQGPAGTIVPAKIVGTDGFNLVAEPASTEPGLKIISNP